MREGVNGVTTSLQVLVQIGQPLEFLFAGIFLSAEKQLRIS